MGAIHSKLYLNLLRFLAVRLRFQVNFDQLKLKFESCSKNRVKDLKELYKYGQIRNNLGRRLAFVRFVEELRLTEREWEEMYSLL